jgi:hypothetical protein
VFVLTGVRTNVTVILSQGQIAVGGPIFRIVYVHLVLPHLTIADVATGYIKQKMIA